MLFMNMNMLTSTSSSPRDESHNLFYQRPETHRLVRLPSFLLRRQPVNCQVLRQPSNTSKPGLLLLPIPPCRCPLLIRVASSYSGLSAGTQVQPDGNSILNHLHVLPNLLGTHVSLLSVTTEPSH